MRCDHREPSLGDVATRPFREQCAALAVEVGRRLVQQPKLRSRYLQHRKCRATALTRRQVTRTHMSDLVELQFREQAIELRLAAPERRVKPEIFGHGQV